MATKLKHFMLTSTISVLIRDYHENGELCWWLRVRNDQIFETTLYVPVFTSLTHFCALNYSVTKIVTSESKYFETLLI